MKVKIMIISLIIFCMTCMYTVCFADDTLTMDNLFETDTSFKNLNEGVSDTGDTGIVTGINTIIGLIQVAGTGVLVIMITFLGIKYMMASIEEKAEIKKTALPIVIGAVLLFGALSIVKTVGQFGEELNNEL